MSGLVRKGAAQRVILQPQIFQLQAFDSARLPGRVKLVFGKVQDLDCGYHLYNIRQAIQLAQSVVVQVQGQQPRKSLCNDLQGDSQAVSSVQDYINTMVHQVSHSGATGDQELSERHHIVCTWPALAVPLFLAPTYPAQSRVHQKYWQR